MKYKDDIRAALKVDVTRILEKQKSKSYKDFNKLENAELLASQVVFNVAKNKLLDEAGDSNYGSSVFEYDLILTDIGFKKVFEQKFDSTSSGQEEVQRIWIYGGVVLHYDTYAGHINKSTFYYNWRPFDFEGREWYNYIDSGHLHETENVWIGYHHGIEAVRFHIEELKSAGEFLNPWIERPFLWFLTHMDTKGEYDYDAINSDIIKKTPELQDITKC